MHVAEPPQLDLGTIRLRWLDAGTFRMDGAAVFGQVPRPIWSTLLVPDVENRVGLRARVLLVETAEELGLIDAGLPDASTLPRRAALDVERASSLQEDLRTLEVDRRDICWVVLTHLHPDHAGGVIMEHTPLFPNARHAVQRREVEAMHDPEYPRPQGLERHPFEVLLAAGLVEPVDGEATVAPGVDDYPLDSIAVKRAQFTWAGQLRAWLTIAHGPDVLALRCGPDGAIAEELRAAGGNGG